MPDFIKHEDLFGQTQRNPLQQPTPAQTSIDLRQQVDTAAEQISDLKIQLELLKPILSYNLQNIDIPVNVENVNAAVTDANNALTRISELLDQVTFDLEDEASKQLLESVKNNLNILISRDHITNRLEIGNEGVQLLRGKVNQKLGIENFNLPSPEIEIAEGTDNEQFMSHLTRIGREVDSTPPMAGTNFSNVLAYLDLIKQPLNNLKISLLEQGKPAELAVLYQMLIGKLQKVTNYVEGEQGTGLDEGSKATFYAAQKEIEVGYQIAQLFELQAQVNEHLSKANEVEFGDKFTVEVTEEVNKTIDALFHLFDQIEINEETVNDLRKVYTADFKKALQKIMSKLLNKEGEDRTTRFMFELDREIGKLNDYGLDKQTDNKSTAESPAVVESNEHSGIDKVRGEDKDKTREYTKRIAEEVDPSKIANYIEEIKEPLERQTIKEQEDLSYLSLIYEQLVQALNKAETVTFGTEHEQKVINFKIKVESILRNLELKKEIEKLRATNEERDKSITNLVKFITEQQQMNNDLNQMLKLLLEVMTEKGGDLKDVADSVWNNLPQMRGSTPSDLGT